MSQAHLGDLVFCSGALVGKIELAHRRASLDTIERADAALGAGGALRRLWHAATREDASKQTGAERTSDNAEEAEELVEASLRWVDEVADAVGITCAMWQTEATDRTLLASAPWVPAAFAEPLRSSLARTSDTLGDRPGRMIGQAAVDGMWLMAESFTDADHRLGGGYARSTLIHYLDKVVRPNLLHGGYTERIGRGLLAAASRLSNLCAFMSFDSGEQGLAQRYGLQALRLVHASGDHALAGHILGDMSMQAQHLARPIPRWHSPKLAARPRSAAARC
ncbi:hypothetical protein BJF78_26195 [Pseudonocardia sp. CNS-139]|nr:hypothetical protein BJF78_26195 [Pseudonocardia sp. CNS-139]